MFSLRDERKSSLVKISGCCLFLAFVCLLFASSLPLFVSARYKGEVSILNNHKKVNFAIGDGLWRRSVCFGDHPDEEDLKKVGLTCDGISQTKSCDKDHLTEKQEKHCDDFQKMQGLQLVAIFAIFFAAFISFLSTRCGQSAMMQAVFAFGDIFTMIVAISCAFAVIRVLKKSDSVHERHFGCEEVFGADLCYSYGASYVLQCIGIADLVIALLIDTFLICAGMKRSNGGIADNTPLLGEGRQ